MQLGKLVGDDTPRPQLPGFGVFETFVDAVIVCEQEIIRYINPAAVRLCGFTNDELRGSKITSRFSFVFDDRSQPAQPADSTQFPRDTDGRLGLPCCHATLTHKNGTDVHVNISISCVRYDINDVDSEMVVWVIRDIAQYKEFAQLILDKSEDLCRDVGRDFHDGIGQRLTALSLIAGSLKLELRQANLAQHWAQPGSPVVKSILGKRRNWNLV